MFLRSFKIFHGCPLVILLKHGVPACADALPMPSGSSGPSCVWGVVHAEDCTGIFSLVAVVEVRQDEAALEGCPACVGPGGLHLRFRQFWEGWGMELR